LSRGLQRINADQCGKKRKNAGKCRAGLVSRALLLPLRCGSIFALCVFAQREARRNVPQHQATALVGVFEFRQRF
jgi:hypothetical protein